MKRKKRENNPDIPGQSESKYNSTDSEKTIRFFSSFEEMNDDDYRRDATLTPAQSLARVTLLRLRMFPYLNIDLNPWGNQVYKD